MKAFLFFAALGIPLSASAGAPLPGPLSQADLPCQAKLSESLAQWEPATRWRKEMTVSREVVAFSSPTSKLGAWLGVHRSGAKLAMTRETQAGRTLIELEAPGCTPRLSVFKKDPPPKGGFDDSALERIVQARKVSQGVILVWSPQMPLSVRALSEAQELLKERKLALIPLLDPHANAAAARRIASERKLGAPALRRLASFELSRRGARLHYPAYFFFRSGELLETMELGYIAPEKLRSKLAKVLPR
jgi:hypothetical protein